MLVMIDTGARRSQRKIVFSTALLVSVMKSDGPVVCIFPEQFMDLGLGKCAWVHVARLSHAFRGQISCFLGRAGPRPNTDLGTLGS